MLGLHMAQGCWRSWTNLRKIRPKSPPPQKTVAMPWHWNYSLQAYRKKCANGNGKGRDWVGIGDACAVPLGPFLSSGWIQQDQKILTSDQSCLNYASECFCLLPPICCTVSRHTRTRQHAEWHLLCAFCTLTSASGRSQFWQKVAVCAHL